MTYKEFDAMKFGDMMDALGDNDLDHVEIDDEVYVNVGGADLPIRAIFWGSLPGTDDERGALHFQTGPAKEPTDTRQRFIDPGEFARYAASILAPAFHAHGWTYATADGGSEVPSVRQLTAHIRELIQATPLDSDDPGDWEHSSGRITVRVKSDGYDNTTNTAYRHHTVSLNVAEGLSQAFPQADPPTDDKTPGTKADWRALARAYQKLTISYRTGRSPSERTLRTIERLQNKLGE